jgi:arylformamidase
LTKIYRFRERHISKSSSSKRVGSKGSQSGYGWIDVSVTLRSGMVHWPGDPEVKIERMLKMESGDDCNVSTISMSSHTGTHIDSPFHFVESGAAIHDLPLSAVIGKARVIEIVDTKSIKPEELRLHRIRKGERILFKTLNSERCWKSDEFVEDFVYISTDSLKYLVDRKVRTIGVDYLSVGGYNKNINRVHQVLLKSGIWIIEGLDLSRVKQGNYELICLPMKIEKGDGAPARAVMRPYKR